MALSNSPRSDNMIDSHKWTDYQNQIHEVPQRKLDYDTDTIW